MRNAIVALVRGYPNNRNLYDELIQRNKSIYEKILSKTDSEIDFILFHEGNISISDQEYIASFSKKEIIFKDVSKYFQNMTISLKGEEKFSLGYRQMCRFNMYYIWKELSEYEYIFRIDEDVEIIDCDPEIFRYMKKNNYNYLTGRFTKETHELTNQTLPDYLLRNTNLNVKKIYNHKNPYTNLYASSVAIWLKEETNSLLETIALNDEQLINRWGDHTVQGILLNLNNEKIKLFHKLEYKHIYPELIIKNNLLRNIFINSKFNPIHTSAGIFTRLKIKIKKVLNYG